MNNSRLKYAVIAALVLNAGTLLFFWLNRPPHGEIGIQKPHFQVLTDALKLTNQQVEIYTEMRKAHRQSVDSILQIVAEKRKVVYAQSPVSRDSALQEIGILQQNIERITYTHFEDLRKICTPAQQIVLNDMLLRTVEKVLGQKEKHRPPHEKEY
jgi:periplasmic protein CpxP/Spy